MVDILFNSYLIFYHFVAALTLSETYYQIVKRCENVYRRKPYNIIYFIRFSLFSLKYSKSLNIININLN
jgi:hypothetical protein